MYCRSICTCLPALLAAGVLAPGTASALPPVIAFSAPTNVDEGTAITVDVTVTDPDGDPVTWSWDTDFDSVFGEMPGATSFTMPASATDGPSTVRIGVQASDGVEPPRTVYRSITVNNLPPDITSHPVSSAAVRREYSYRVTVDEPAGANDPIEYLLTTAPTGMEITAEGLLTWTPSIDQRGRSVPVVLRVTDGDGADDSQSWTIEVARNAPPSSPTPVSPVMREPVAEAEPVTLVAENGTDPDDDALTYFFRLSRSSLFEPPDIIGSGEVSEGAEGTTSWTTPEALEPGLWYWQVWVSDGIVETVPRHAHVLVGNGELPDGGPVAADGGGLRTDGGVIPGFDAGTGGGDDGGCSVGGAPSSRGGLPWLAALLLAALLIRHRPRRRRGGSAVGIVLASVVLLVTGCTSGGDGDGDGPGTDAGPVGDDSDFDGISNEDEEARLGTDTDLDGTPDYLDTDSDNDGIPDAAEAGDADLASQPRDSDDDGVPDFRDEDADGNGIPDSYEGSGDADLDGLPDYADLDDDNDLVRDPMELEEIFHPPTDADADGVPNYQDPDSDDDTILDGDEFGADTDGDGLRDFEDRDSDNDGISDSAEAGDGDLYSQPVDSDADMIPDFRDTDSDNDGLSDRSENDRGTNPTAEDSDGDGVTDLIEVGAGTDPLDDSVSPRTRGDFVFVVPYEEEPDPTRDTLEFRTSLQLVDIYFLFDISGSMSGEIDSLRSAVTSIIGDVTCTDFGSACMSDGDCAAGEACSVGGSCIEDPAVSSCIASPFTGGGIYEEDLENLLSLQPNPAHTSTALSVSTFGGTESLYRAVWATADPMGAPGTATGCATPMPGFVGCPAFREDAVKILVAFTDEDSDGSETAADAAAALRHEDITFIGVWSGTSSSSSRQDLVDLAVASDSLSGAGAPLVFDGQDAAVVPAVTSAINEVVQGVPIRVTIEPTDEPDDAGNSLQFIDYLVVNTSGAACSAVGTTEDTDDDGYDDAFPSLLPGTPVCWDVVPKRNDTVEPAGEPLIFRARLTVYGDGSPLDSRIVYFLVPPIVPPPDIPI